MAKAFSVASWNVEHFGALDSKTNKPAKPIEPVIEFLALQDAELIAIYEVRSEYVFRPIVEAMPDYQFHITEGPQMQEILIGIRKKFTAFITQKIEFQSGQSTLRPGVLATLTIDGEYYILLFLHLKSFPDPKGFGLRDDMMYRALKFRSTLNKVAGDPLKTNYIFMGDLNTMGFDYPYKAFDISAEDEIKELDRRAKYRKMRRLPKTFDLSWWNGSDHYAPGSNLDHVVASNHLSFKKFNGAEVSVRGWAEEMDIEKQKEWIHKYSDHNLLYFEVQKV